MNAMTVCETNYETCGAGQSESSDSVSDSSSSESLGNAEIPHQSSVMAIVRERLRTAHGLEHTESDHFIWSTESEVYEEELPLAKRRSCMLPLRFVISSLIIIAILASSCTMYAYLMMQWSRAHGETLNLFREADLKILRNVSLSIFFVIYYWRPCTMAFKEWSPFESYHYIFYSYLIYLVFLKNMDGCDVNRANSISNDNKQHTHKICTPCR